MNHRNIDKHRSGLRLLTIVLGILALFDLRIELMLLFDHFTWTTLTEAVRSHLLAVVVLLALPTLARSSS
jgi:hypothetical protein